MHIDERSNVFLTPCPVFNFSKTEINTQNVITAAAEVYVLKPNKSMYATPRISGISEVSEKTNAL